jgi:hypothetical protein
LWHFDHSISDNSPPATLELAVVQGGGTRILSSTNWPSPGSAATDFFYKGNNTEFGEGTKPASSWNDGSKSGLRIYDISANASPMTFSVGTGVIPDAAASSPDASSDLGAPDSATDTNEIRRDAVGDSKDGMAGEGGATSAGGAVGTGGMRGAGGAIATGGATSSGGTVSTGGTVSSGGAFSSGGTTAGGNATTGGATSGKGGQAGTGESAKGGAAGNGGAAGAGTRAQSSSSGCSCAMGTQGSPMPVSRLFVLAAIGLARFRKRKKRE